MVVTVTPSDPKTELNVYAYSVGLSDTKTVPPNVSSVVSCEASTLDCLDIPYEVPSFARTRDPTDDDGLLDRADAN